MVCWIVTFDDRRAPIAAARSDAARADAARSDTARSDAARSDDRRAADAWLAALDSAGFELTPIVDDEPAAEGDGVAGPYAAIGIESTRRGLEIGEDDAPAGARRVLTHGELVGRAVLRVRLYWGWSQKELERRSGVDQTTISRLERGVQRGLSVRRFFAILRALRVSDVTFSPPVPVAPPTALELMLRGDPWERAIRAADARLSRRRSA